MPLLELHNVKVRYGAIEALHGIDLNVEQGQIVALLGANGAGKSTTLRTVSGLLRPASGTVLFDGKPIQGLPPHKIVELGIAHVPEGRGIFANFTVDENLAVGAYTRSDKAGVAADRERVLEMFPRLRERLRQNAGTLSGGEQQMLAIGRALLARPRLLLLDEPSLGLAPQIVRQIFALIRRINADGTTILLVEQNVHMALDAASYGYVLEVGSIAMHDFPATLKTSDQVRKAYLGVA
ncbi:MAG: ABC transporter ATP-binding protein [Planctomycetota bacterium]|nr:ABC transporter ATP-binding protein [Planctomycetota bacterium]